MSKSKSSISYEVPNRGLVVVPLDETKWPRAAGQTAYVPRWAIVPDPDQPRQDLDDDDEDLSNLGNSIKVNGQSELMKTRLLTNHEREKFRLPNGSAPMYMIVSGGRRWLSTAPDKADVPILEIRVAAYATADEQFLDGYIINEDRKSLTPRDSARALKQILERQCKGSISELCRVTSKSRGFVDTYLPINNLVPEALRFLDRKLPDKVRMSVNLASALGKLSHEKQRRYLGPLMSGEAGRSASQRIRWLTDQLVRDSTDGVAVRGHGEEKSIHYYHRFERLIDIPRANASIILSASDQLFADAFKLLGAQECANLLRQYETMEDLLRKVKERFVSVTVNKKTFLQRNKDVLPGWRVASYYNQGHTLISDALVSPEKYDQLKALKWLAWQREGGPDPDETAAESKGVPSVAFAGESVKQNGGQLPPDSISGVSTADTVVVSYFRHNGGRQPRLLEGQAVTVEEYKKIRSDRSLFWQRNNLKPSSAEEAFCQKHGLVFIG